MTTACSLHNVADCSNCFRAAGECDWGSCQRKGVVRLGAFGTDGGINEVRHSCRKHETMMTATTRNEASPTVHRV